MKYISDLHIHSYYSRATSKKLNLEHLNKWAQIKGLNVIATGDLTHPKWFDEIQTKLKPCGNGLYQLKPEYASETQKEVPASCASDVYFIFSGEISNIYKKNDRVRKNHNVVFLPTFDSVAKIQQTLDRIGNIHSDGRPILGLDSHDLLEIVLDTDPNGHLIPAHIWTPWFSLLGSKSGFDTIEECFEDLTSHIFAVETGLSSDPPMNWRLSMLDSYSLVSNSDAHSPEKLAREANLFNTDLSYFAMFEALKNKNSDDFCGTIEFFPEEGKYHMDGHRNCNCMTHPQETIANNGLCPVCGKPAVLGVSYRVEELSDRPIGEKPEKTKPFKSLIPLPEVLSEVYNVGPKSKRIQNVYFSMLQDLGSELSILMDISINDIQSHSGDLTAEAIKRMREGQVHPIPGYDGEFGIIRIFDEQEKAKIQQQGSLFSLSTTVLPEKKTVAPDAFSKSIKNSSLTTSHADSTIQKIADDKNNKYGLNQDQSDAVEHRGSPLIIQAGPGTGKTRTLTHRIASMLKSGDVESQHILAITFTNKAAEEMRQRLKKLVGRKTCEEMTVSTFHAFGTEILRQTDSFAGRNKSFTIVDTANNLTFRDLFKNKFGKKITSSLLEHISFLKNHLYEPDTIPESILEILPENITDIYSTYESCLVEINAVDYDDLIKRPVFILRKQPEIRRTVLTRYQAIFVDEFQDINKAQYEFFRLFAMTTNNVCVIGDPDQAIYGFRGASRDFFINFTNDFPLAKSIRLKQNYRSAQNILAASVQMLKKDKVGNSKNLWSNIAPDTKLYIHQAANERAEAEFIVHKIEQLVGGTSNFSFNSQRVKDQKCPDYGFADFAILLRTKSLAAPFIEALTRSGIPFETIDHASISGMKAIQILSSSLSIYSQVNENIDFGALITHFIKEDEQLFNHISNLSSLTLEMLENKNNSLNSNPLDALLTFTKNLKNLPGTTTADQLVDFVWKKTDLAATLEEQEAQRLFKMLLSLAQPFGDNLLAFIDALALQKSIDHYDERGDRVHLLTLHASKGLEFPAVFIPACEEGIIPYLQKGQHADIEEEQRLLYVGMTRAQQHLYLTHAKSRLLFGNRDDQKPMRFLQPISVNLIKREKKDIQKNTRAVQLKFFN